MASLQLPVLAYNMISLIYTGTRQEKQGSLQAASAPCSIYSVQLHDAVLYCPVVEIHYH